MDTAVVILQTLPAYLWPAIGFFAIIAFRRAIHEDLLPYLQGFKALGFELTFARQSLDAAVRHRRDVVMRSTVNKGVTISVADRQRAIARAKRCADLLRDRLILWVDDEPANNRFERRMLRAFGMTCELIRSNDQALSTLEEGGEVYDLIISDIERPPGEPSGLDLLKEYLGRGGKLPIIFYIARVDADKPLPCGAFGLTNRPDELLHLILDVLERRSKVSHDAVASL